MYVYRLRIRPERAPDVWRVFEFSARHTLHDVHNAIQRAFKLDDDHLYAFYRSGKHWDRASEVAHEDADRVRLFQLGLAPGKRFSYVFDFGDELWHQLEVVAVSESESALEEPLLVEAVGAAPPQYEHLESDALPSPDVNELLPLASELVGLLASEPDLATDAGLQSLRSAHRVAVDLTDRLEADAARFWAMEEASDGELLGLLLELPLVLARAGMVDEGDELALALSFVDPAHFLADRAILLAEAGQRETALSQVRENLQSMGDDAWVEVKAGNVYALLGEAAEAEARFRAVLERAPDDATRAAARVHLLVLLRSQHREAEIAALETAERLRIEEQQRIEEQLRTHDSLAEPVALEAPWRSPDTTYRLGPKVGRNDPCPCGSRKKHKKCCGANA